MLINSVPVGVTSGAAEIVLTAVYKAALRS